MVTDSVPDALDFPRDALVRELDVGSMPPPEPLVKTLETLESVDDGVVVVQHNDRAPLHLYPKLDDRGYEYRSVERDDDVVTAIWRS